MLKSCWWDLWPGWAWTKELNLGLYIKNNFSSFYNLNVSVSVMFLLFKLAMKPESS